jgi:hypothetical protein
MFLIPPPTEKPKVEPRIRGHRLIFCIEFLGQCEAINLHLNFFRVLNGWGDGFYVEYLSDALNQCLGQYFGKLCRLPF